MQCSAVGAMLIEGVSVAPLPYVITIYSPAGGLAGGSPRYLATIIFIQNVKFTAALQVA